jgi:hypothetical protein
MALKWTDEKLSEEAKKYKTRGEFLLNSKNAYAAARGKGKDFLDVVCSHMDILRTRWTDEKLIEEAKKYSTRSEFQRENSGSYQSARNRGKDFMDSVCNHMATSVTIWTEEKLREEAKKYLTRKEFQIGSGSAYVVAHRKGKHFLNEICEHMVSGHFRWSLTEVMSLAKKFENRDDFLRNSGGAFGWARNNKKLDEVCAHMKRMYPPLNFNKVAEAAKKFETRGKFQREEGSAYVWAQRNGHLNEVCAHMVEGKNGFKRSQGGFLYQFRVVHGQKIYYKVGITNSDPEDRATGFGIKYGVYIERTHAIWYDYGGDCQDDEKALKDAAKAKGLQHIGRELMKNGFTEIFTKPLLE